MTAGAVVIAGRSIHHAPATRAALFDLDGTLVDSETATDAAIEAVMARHGVAGVALPPAETRGRTWLDIVSAIDARFGVSVSPAELEAAWIDRAAGAAPIPGAAGAIRDAVAAGLGIAIVSSSGRRVIDRFLEGLGVSSLVAPDARIGAESVTRAKPDPQGYLLASSRLAAAPAECVVFEDSTAGLTAARDAGMCAIAVLRSSAEAERCRSLAHGCCADYLALPEGFFAALAAGTLDPRGGDWR